MRIKSQSPTTIKYILIGNGSDMIAPFIPPEDIDNEVINFLMRSPIDLFQLYNPLQFFTLCISNELSLGYNFNVLFEKDFEKYQNIFKNKKQIQLFFLDGTKKAHINVYKNLKPNKQFRFFYFYKSPPELHDGDIVNNADEFVQKLIHAQKEIIRTFQITHYKNDTSVRLEFKDFNKFNYFTPTKNNYFLIERIIGNFGVAYNSENEIIKEKSSEALSHPHSFHRQNHFIDQIKKIDNFISLHYAENIIKPVMGTEPILAPLIYISPFHNPDIKKNYGKNTLMNSFQIEQDKNYLHHHKVKDTANHLGEDQKAGMQLQIERVKYLDDIGFLHSSFRFSPIIRVPMKGKSIYRELSFFKPESFNIFNNKRIRTKLKKTIIKFGKKLQEETISDEIKKLIKKRNGQIVAISDLPIEWLIIDNIPLAFTHDICRLPETSLHGLMSLYASNQRFEYSIPSNIIKRTLVILGTHEPEFKMWHTEVHNLSKNLSFKVVACNNLLDVKNAIHKHKPEFIIFDTHGGYDKETNSSFLYIGDEKLDGDYIVKNNISAPLIFLSACGTAPTYGTIHPIANAFFEAGSLSVTSTYLPITVNSGSLLYYRILYKLANAADKPLHKNWLEFVCHVSRSSAISDAFLIAYSKNKKGNTNEIKSFHAETLMETLYFHKRRKLYHELDKKLSQLTENNRLHFSLTIPEYLLYTHMGRSDLILFDSWKKSQNNIQT